MLPVKPKKATWLQAPCRFQDFIQASQLSGGLGYYLPIFGEQRMHVDRQVVEPVRRRCQERLLLEQQLEWQLELKQVPSLVLLEEQHR